MTLKTTLILCLLLSTLALQSKKWLPIDSIVAGQAKVVTNNLTTGTSSFTLPDEFQCTNCEYLAAANTISIYYYDFFTMQVSISILTTKSFQMTFMMNSTSSSTRTQLYASYLFIDKNKITSGLNIFQKDYTLSSGSQPLVRNFTYSETFGRDAVFAIFFRKIGATGYLRDMNIAATINVDASYNIEVVITIGVNTSVNTVGVNYLAVQKATLTSNYGIEVDIGSYAGNSGAMSGTSLGVYKTADYMVGINSFYVYTDSVTPFIKTAYFEFRDTVLTAFEGSVYSIKMVNVNFRTWGCPKTSPYFIKNSTSDCIDVCASGYYGDNSTWNCEKCHYSCTTCSLNSTNEACLSCDSTNKRTLSTKKCLCNSGFFENSVALCGSCISNCSVCTNATGCQTCISSTISITLFGDSVSVSFVKNSLSKCIICAEKMTNCIQCTDDNVCTKCYKDNDVWRVKSDASGCQCNAASQYFLTASNDCKLCSQLIVGCLTCSNNQTCSSCDGSKNFTSSGATCICKPGFILQSSQCIPCHFSCTTCLGTTTNCTSCSSSNKRVSTPTSNTCPCITNYFEENTAVCATCLKVCSTCTTSTTCTDCTTNTNLTLNGNICQCLSTKYALINSDHCQLCSFKITYCDTCSDYQNCTACQYVNYTVAADKKSCVCSTSTQYFLNSSNTFCVKCQDIILGCLTCTDKSTCQTCDASKNFVSSGSICKCASGYYLDGIICKKCAYSCKECQVSATRCTVCDTTNNRIGSPNSNHECTCTDKFYDNSVAICPPCLKVCATCSTSNTCQTCTLNTNLTLSNKNCTCISNQYAMINYQYCQLCSIQIDHCLTCSSSINCTSCNAQNYTISTTYKCQCSTSSQYFSNGTLTFCAKCPDIIHNCQTCTKESSTSFSPICQTCISNFTTIPTQKECTCDTANNFFPRGLICPHCTDLIRGCVNCTSTLECNLCFLPNNTMGINNLTCDCDKSLEYHTWNSGCVLCPDLILGCVNCSNNSTCTVCDEPGFFRLDASKCVCKDGYYLSGRVCLPCDVSCVTCVNAATFCLTCNNTALRTFVDNRCDCQQYFSDCRSSGINQCENHTCSLLNPVELIISSMIKDPEQNKLTFQITFNPVLPEYNSFDFSSLFNIGFPSSAQIYYSYLNGVLTVEINYFENLQGNQTLMTFPVNQTPYWYFKLAPESSLKYQIAPTNNLAANIYPQSVYHRQKILSTVSIILSVLGIFVYLIGLLSSKIIVSEMVAVMQIAYLGLFIIDYGDPYFYSLRNLQYSNGLNNLVSGSLQQNSPSRVYYSGHSSSVISNLNLMLGLILIPPIMSFICYQIYKRSTKYRIRMEKYWKLILGEWSLTLFIFLLYNYSSSLTGFCLFTRVFNVEFYMSILEILVLSVIFGLLIYMFVTKNHVWMGEFKERFNWNFFSGNYYLIPIGQRFLIGIILTAGNMSYISAIIAICCLLASITLIIAKKPFVQNYENYRSILTNIYSIAILSIYIAYRVNGPSKGESIFMYFPYIIIVILTLNILTAIIFVVISFVNKSKFKKIDKQCQKQDQEDDQLHQQVNRKIQEMIKEAKSNNINNRLMNKMTRKETPATPTIRDGGGMNNYKAIWNNIPKMGETGEADDAT